MDVVQESGGPDELLAQLQSAQEATALRREVMARLTAELTETVYYGESPGGDVLANVDGNGVLIALQVDPASVRSSHPELVGEAITTAINAARAVAAQEKEQRVSAVFGPEPGL